jgi:hypothetical protein
MKLLEKEYFSDVDNCWEVVHKIADNQIISIVDKYTNPDMFLYTAYKIQVILRRRIREDGSN